MAENNHTIEAPRLLIVSDDRQLHRGYVYMLTAPPSVLGNRYLAVAVSYADALQGAADDHFDLAIIDLAAHSGLVLATRLHQQAPRLCLVLLAEASVAAQQRASGITNETLIVERPVEAARLRAAVSQLLRR